MMAGTSTGASSPSDREARAERESRQQERSGGIVVVDLEEPQPSRLVSRLRKGRGKLMNRVDRIVNDLVAAGTVKSTAQPVVIVVREVHSPFDFLEEDEDDDD